MWTSFDPRQPGGFLSLCSRRQSRAPPARRARSGRIAPAKPGRDCGGGEAARCGRRRSSSFRRYGRGYLAVRRMQGAQPGAPRTAPRHPSRQSSSPRNRSTTHCVPPALQPPPAGWPGPTPRAPRPRLRCWRSRSYASGTAPARRSSRVGPAAALTQLAQTVLRFRRSASQPILSSRTTRPRSRS
uniref:Uncharacterized protein LOC109695533 isoform X2 n=1 Tax=Castor canadensis TaxID=51338 RepID=A0A8B7VR39_CASCN|nr:uncharacterized protein LOC109695533 isoform X2 [Castor canadensis]